MTNILQDDLDAFGLGDEELGEIPEDDTPLALDRIEDVSFALRRLASVERQLDRIAAVAAAEVKRIDLWASDRRSGLLCQREWFQRSIERWARAHHERTDKGTTWKLPYGTVALRKGRERVEVMDGAAVELLAFGDGNLVHTTHSVDKTAVKARTAPGSETIAIQAPDGYRAHCAVTDDGEPLPHVYFLVPTRLDFSVKVNDEDEPDEM